MPRQFPPSDLHPSEVEVCADCLRAECLDGVDTCAWQARNGETAVQPVAYLRQLKLESSEAWARDDLRP